MKNYSYLLFFSILIIFSSCCHKIVRKITISNLSINNVEINSDSLMDTLNITKKINYLDTISYTYNKKEEKLWIPYLVLKNKILISEAIKDSLIKNPIIKYIHIDSINFTNLKKKFQFHIDSINVDKFILKTIHINKKNTPIPYDSKRLKTLESEYYKTRKRIDSLKQIFNEKIKQDPNHSAKDVSPKLFEGLDSEMKSIYNYIYNSSHLPSITEAKIDELSEINLKLDRLLSELKNPGNEPIPFSNQIFFELGKYKIESNKIIEDLEKYINEIYNKIDLIKANKEIIVTITVTGYADDIIVLSDLEAKLISLYSNKKCDFILEKDKQECLAQLLSEQRALNVFEYIKNKIINHYNGLNLKIEPTPPKPTGKGIEYPPEIPKGSCPGNCNKRRVVYISRFLQY